MKMKPFWDMAPCSLVEIGRRSSITRATSKPRVKNQAHLYPIPHSHLHRPDGGGSTHP
jgi:hypothetical protein